MKQLLYLNLFFHFSIFAQIIPAPKTVEYSNQKITLERYEISVSPEHISDENKSFLVFWFEKMCGLEVKFTAENPLILFSTVKNTPTDWYSINFDSQIRIQYSSEASAMYAISTCIQSFESDDEFWVYKKGSVSDFSDFQWRGMHLDVSRHFFSVEEVKTYIDWLSFYKFSVFHWHLTDDQGWRIESKLFPKLTSVGAWRDSTVVGHYNDSPRRYDVKKYGGFYTQDQIKDVVAYAKSRHVEVVPEIEMPGHARAALAAYPEFSCTEKALSVPGLWGVFDDIFCSKPQTIHFLQAILDEIIPLFDSKYIHIGGDEAPKLRWESCSKCQQVMQQNQLEDAHQLQSYFIQQMDSFLTSKGKTLIGWDEILEGGLSPNAVVMSWRGNIGGIEAAKQAHNVIMAPNSHCYFDYYQSGLAQEPLAIGGFLPLSKVYAFSPIPTEIEAEYQSYILGGQANVWTEYIPTFDALQYMVFPRILAISERLWNAKSKSYNEFEKELIQTHFPRLDQLGINYSKAILYPSLQVEKSKSGIKYSFLSARNEHYSISAPNADRVAENSIEINRQSLFESPVNCSVRFGENSVDSIHFSFERHLAMGKSISFTTQPKSPYTERGALSLTDGIRGNKPWKGNEWLGFNQDSVIFQLDLEEKTTVKNIEVGFLRAEGSWIYLPKSVSLFSSKNGRKWKEISLNEIKEKSIFNINKKIRFIRVETKSIGQIPPGAEGSGNIPWTFIDEVVVN